MAILYILAIYWQFVLQGVTYSCECKWYHNRHGDKIQCQQVLAAIASDQPPLVDHLGKHIYNTINLIN